MYTSWASLLLAVLLAASATAAPVCQSNGLKLCRLSPGRTGGWLSGHFPTIFFDDTKPLQNLTESTLAFNGSDRLASLPDNLGGLPRLADEGEFHGKPFPIHLKSGGNNQVWPHGKVVLDFHYDGDPVIVHVMTGRTSPPFNAEEAYALRELRMQFGEYAHRDRYNTYVQPRSFLAPAKPATHQRRIMYRLVGGPDRPPIPKEIALAVSSFVGGLIFDCVSRQQTAMIEIGATSFGTVKHPGLGTFEIWIGDSIAGLGSPLLGNTTTF